MTLLKTGRYFIPDPERLCQDTSPAKLTELGDDLYHLAVIHDLWSPDPMERAAFIMALICKGVNMDPSRVPNVINVIVRLAPELREAVILKAASVTRQQHISNERVSFWEQFIEQTIN